MFKINYLIINTKKFLLKIKNNINYSQNKKIMNTNDSDENSSQDSAPDYNFKLIIVGDAKVGKTSLVKFEISNCPLISCDPTPIFAHFYKNYIISKKTIGLQIWDISGEEIYRSMLKRFYRLSLCIFIVFSLENSETFRNIPIWLDEIQNNSDSNNEDSIKILIGTKTKNDINTKIKKEVIDNFIRDNNIQEYFEVNVKTGENIHELFKNTALKLFNKFVAPTLNNNNEPEESNDNFPNGKGGNNAYKNNNNKYWDNCLCYHQ